MHVAVGRAVDESTARRLAFASRVGLRRLLSETACDGQVPPGARRTPEDDANDGPPGTVDRIVAVP